MQQHICYAAFVLDEETVISQASHNVQALRRYAPDGAHIEVRVDTQTKSFWQQRGCYAAYVPDESAPVS